MKEVVWLSIETPDAGGGGGQRRQFHQIKTLVELGIHVRAVILKSPQADDSLRQVVPVSRFESRRFPRSGLDPSLLKGAAGAVVAHLESLRYFERALRQLHIPFAVDLHNVNSRWHAALGETRAAARWQRAERHALAITQSAFACSTEEAAALRALEPGARVEVAGHGVTAAEWPETALVREATVAMFGSWQHRPNREAAEWLGSEVWPRIVERVPTAQLLFMGPGDPPHVAGARVMGRVSSLADALGRVRVVAVPIQHGIGARVKFGEALASGAAVVSTSAGAEGFDADGAFVRADDSAVFAEACARLLLDARSARELGARGRAIALSDLTWDRTSAPLVRWIERVVS